jgi:hypothetical protein
MQNDSDSTTAWAGFAMFAGFMMVLIGAFQAIAGLVGIIDDQFYVLGVKYVFEFDTTTWVDPLDRGHRRVPRRAGGLQGLRVGAHTVGVIVVMLNAIVNFAFLPYYPVVDHIITVDVLVSLGAHLSMVASRCL